MLFPKIHFCEEEYPIAQRAIGDIPTAFGAKLRHEFIIQKMAITNHNTKNYLHSLELYLLELYLLMNLLFHR